MKQLTYIVLAMILFSCGQKQESGEQIIINRMDYVYGLKTVIDRDIWKGFNESKYDVPLVYYTDSSCFVANPLKRFMDAYKPELVYENEGLKIYKSVLVDSVPFHMAANLSLGDDEGEYNFESPYLACSSFEIARNVIPDLNSTEEWMTMLVHEYFHGFQFKHKGFIDYFQKNAMNLSSRDLKKLYFSNKWFKEIVDKENDLLLKAIASDDKKVIRECVNKFFELRDKRRALAVERLKLDIKSVEETYETMEGTARYIEFSLYGKFAKMEPDAKLAKCDTSYCSFAKFKDFDINNDQWLFDTKKTTYFYATGYNILRLFDKLGIEYKSRLFKEKGLSLEKILKTSVEL